MPPRRLAPVLDRVVEDGFPPPDVFDLRSAAKRAGNEVADHTGSVAPDWALHRLPWVRQLQPAYTSAYRAGSISGPDRGDRTTRNPKVGELTAPLPSRNTLRPANGL